MTRKILILFAFILFAQPVLAAEEEWHKYDSSHFIIYYKNAPTDFAKNVAETAESLYDEITRNLGFTRYHGWSRDDRAVIYIYDDHDEYKKHARNMEWSGGMANVEKKEIKTYAAESGFFDSTLPHELGHIIFHEFIKYNPVPLWLDEGVAMYQEKAKRWGANKAVQMYLSHGKFIPLNELTRERLFKDPNKEIVNIFYAESASIVYYMIVEQGESRFENLCRRLSDGIAFEEALDASYGRFTNIQQLNDAWVSYLKD